MMSESIGPFCDVNQDITSWNISEGAAVALDLIEYERESKTFYNYVYLSDKIAHAISRICWDKTWIRCGKSTY